MRKLLLLLSITFLSVFACVSSQADATPREITRLKHLHLQTALVRNGMPTAVLVVPPAGFLAGQAEMVAAAIKARTGSAIRIVSDATAPEELLKSSNVIAIGNMATNRFIGHLYRQWQVILDLQYPGRGGYVVRSLHDPYGSGHNVIFLGGSDDTGVVAAVSAFVDRLHVAKQGTLSVGRLMEISLGAGLNPPAIGAFMAQWPVHSWNDSRRRTSAGRETGYAPATTFGWNPISIAGTLYYLTGRKEYLDCFKALAMPDPRNLPLPNRTDDAFIDPADPLVKNNHYRSHLVDRVFDLIEESPLFSDQERLHITNKLLMHQIEYDPKHTYTAPNGDRHGLWHLMNIYTGSKYFATYYPDPVWNKRIVNVRTSFRAFLGNPTWGDRDTLYWVSTSLEPVFEFFLMDGYDEFVGSGTAKTMLRALEVLMTGDEVDDSNKFLSMGLLLRAAHMTGDDRYLWQLRRAGYDMDVFRIGQSYWPSTMADPTPPTDLVGTVAVVPLAGKDRASSGTAVSEGEGFQVLSYRTGLERHDDYFLLDGFEGLGRHPYQVNTLLRLRMFGGKDVLSGYGSGLHVWFNGMNGSSVARAAALQEHVAAPTFAYVRTEVPDMPGSRWQRHLLYLKGEAAVVLDQVTAREAGAFDFVSSWQLGGKITHPATPSRRVLTGNGTGLASADLFYGQSAGTVVRGKISRTLAVNESLGLATVFSKNSRPKSVAPLRGGGYLVSGDQSAFVGVGLLNSAQLGFTARFCWLAADRLVLVGATNLTVGGTAVFRADRPVSLLWDLPERSLRVVATDAATLTIGGTVLPVAAGEHVLAGVVVPVGLERRIAAVLADLNTEAITPASAVPPPVVPTGTLQKRWQLDLSAPVTAIAAAGSEQDGFWLVGQDKHGATLARIAADGSVRNRQRQPGEILSLWPAANASQQRAFGLLAGFRDDMLRAFGDDGRPVWAVKAALHPSFVIGDRYEAPWFTDPRLPYNKAGVYSLLVGDLWGTGREEIALGRPCTVEFRTLDGGLTGRVPTRWGDTTALAVLKKPGKLSQTPLLLAGKAYTGNPQLSAVNRDYRTVSDHLFDGISPGFIHMQAWLQRGMAGLRVADLDGDGSEEVIYTLSGNWNELRVYGSSGAISWMKYFGPDQAVGGFMTALETADLDGDGRQEILVATRMGWLHVFDSRGGLRWQRRFNAGITSLAVAGPIRRLAVGCSDGSVLVLAGDGATLASDNLASPPRSMALTRSGLVVGTETGLVRSYSLPR
jgi:hypothetical protein